MTALDAPVVAARRERLRAWIGDRFEGSRKAFIEEAAARGYKIDPTEVSNLQSGKKSFGEKKAAMLEEQAAMPPGYLVTPFKEVTKPKTSQSVRLNVEKLANLIETVEAAVTQSRRQLPAHTKAKIIATLYSHDQAAAASSPQAVQVALASILASME